MITSRRGFARIPPLLVVLGAMAAWSLIQWLPVPGALPELVYPELHDLRRAGEVLANAEGVATLSLDAPATLRAVVFYATLLGISVVALRLATLERGRYALHASVGVVAGGAALVVGLHELFDANALYGLYTPRQRPVVMGPLLNTNHLGSLLALGTLTNLGLAFYAHQPTSRRVVWALLTGSCAAATLSTLSRGAVLGLALGAVVFLCTLFAQRLRAASERARRRRERLFLTTAPIFVIAACGVIVMIYVAASSAIAQIENTSLNELEVETSKFSAWKSALTLVDEAPWTGVGRGAFESAFTRVHPASALATFSHPENALIQALVEWGIPATIAIGALLVWLALRTIRRWKNGSLGAGALGALIAVAFQSNFDFGIELLGVALPTCILLASSSYVSLATYERSARRRRTLRAGLTGVLALGALVLLSNATRTLADDHRDISIETPRAELVATISRHPLDYVAFGMLAEDMLRGKDPGAVRVLNHALRLHPTHAGLHRLAARLLLRAKLVDQAAGEYETALRYSPKPGPLLEELAAVLPADLAARSIPVELNRQRTIQHLIALDQTRLAIAWLRRVVIERKDHLAAEQLYTLAVKMGDRDAAELAAAARCRHLPSTRCELDHARLLLEAGKPSAVIELLHDVHLWTGRKDDKLAAWLVLCDAYLALRDRKEAGDCLRGLTLGGLTSPLDPQVKQRQDALDALTTPPP